VLFSDPTERFANRRPFFAPFQVDCRVGAFRCVSAERAIQEVLAPFSCEPAPFTAQNVERSVSSSRS